MTEALAYSASDSEVPPGAPPKRRKRRFAERFTLGMLVPVAGLILWQTGARNGWVDTRLLPPPTKLLGVFDGLVRGGDLHWHVIATLARVLPGFAAGALAGTVAGAASGGSTLLRNLIDPLVQALRAVPSLAWVPLFILWFGIFETSKIILIAVGVFFPVYLGVMQAVASVDRKLVEVGRVFGLSWFQIIVRIHLPAVLPQWIVALRTGLGLGFMFVVAAELMGASEGLGYLLLDGQQLGKPGQILVALILFAIAGQVADAVIVLVTRPLLAWQDIERMDA